jgi:hypothetical protein
MSRERLQHLITVLQGVPAEQFTLSTWRENRDCGTVACAIGWACLDPVFIEQGLTLVYEQSQYGGNAAAFQPRLAGTEDWLTGFDVASQFFDITLQESLNLFSSGSYGRNPTTADVIARIEKLLARGETK